MANCETTVKRVRTGATPIKGLERDVEDGRREPQEWSEQAQPRLRDWNLAKGVIETTFMCPVQFEQQKSGASKFFDSTKTGQDQTELFLFSTS